MSKLYTGYQAALRGAYEGQAIVVGSSDPRFGETKPISVESLISKALGLSLSGKRALAVVDKIDTRLATVLTHTGVGAGCVLVYCQNTFVPQADVEQVAHLAHLMTIAPSSVYECKTYVKIAFNLSEKYDTPVLVYLSEGLCGASTSLEIVDPKTLGDKPYQKNIEKYVTLPSSVRLCAEDRVYRDRRMQEDCESFPLHNMVLRDTTVGVVTSGDIAVNVSAVAPHLSVLRLGTLYPIPFELIASFAAKVDELIVIEEGDPLLETQLKARDIKCHGKDLFPLAKHYSPAEIKERLLGVDVPKEETGLPLRSPMFAPDHPLLDVFVALKKRGLPVHTEVGVAMLAAESPLETVDTAFVDNPVAFANGFAVNFPCVSVTNAAKVDFLLADLEGCNHLAILWGNVDRASKLLAALDLPFVKTSPAKVGELNMDKGIVLVDTEGDR